MQAIKKKNFQEPIIISKILSDSTLLVVDAKTNVRVLDRDAMDVISGFKGGISHPRYKTSVVSFSNNGQYFASLSEDCKESRLYNARTKKLIAKVDRHHGEVSCVGIDPKSHYMFSCGDDGKVYAIDVQSGKLSFTISAHIDTINDIAFSRNSQWIATAGYDKRVTVYNLSMMSIKHKLRFHSAPITKLHFLNKHRLFSVDKFANAVIWDVYSGTVVSKLQGVHDDVTQVISSSDDRFLFLGTALGYILVYDLESYELLSRSYIKLTSSITSLGFYEESEQLVVGCENGQLLIYDLYREEPIIKELIQKHRFSEVDSYLTKNPLLVYTPAYKLFEQMWNETFEKAKLLLQSNHRDKAEIIFQSFKDIKAKNKIIQKTMQDYEGFSKFYEMAKAGKLALAYSLANAKPAYKESKIFKSLEAKWKAAFALAQNCSFNPREQDKAREILAPYRGISEKTVFIQEIFSKGSIYKRFIAALDKKDFKLIFELIKLHPFLKEFPEYDTLIKYSDTLYIKALKHIEDKNFLSAIKILNILVNFTDFKSEVHLLLIEISNKNKFFSAIKDDDTTLAYNLLDNVLELQETQEGKQLQKEWNNNLEIANSFATKADVAQIRKYLKKYMNIDSKIETIATIFGWCYVVELENALKNGQKQSIIEKGIKKHIKEFGLQEQLINFFETFKKHYPESKLNPESLPKGAIKNWNPSMIVNSILD